MNTPGGIFGDRVLIFFFLESKAWNKVAHSILGKDIDRGRDKETA